MTKKTLLTVVAVSLLSGSLVVATNAYAQTSTPANNPMSTLVQQIADKFHVNKADVQAVFDQNRQDMQSKMEANYEAKLDQLVKDGKINAQQKQLLLDKHKQLQSEMQSNRANDKNLTPAERKAQIDKERQDITAWAKQNGVDAKYLMMMGPGMRGHRGFGMRAQTTITPTPTQ